MNGFERVEQVHAWPHVKEQRANGVSSGLELNPHVEANAFLLSGQENARALRANRAGDELKFTFGEGRVTIVAHEVTVDDILGEWARQGQTIIVNGDKLTGPPVTLALEDVSEAEALDVVLRSASGYVVSYRTPPIPGASAFTRIVIVPTSQPPAAPPAPPMPPVSLGVSPTGSLQLTSTQPTPALGEEGSGLENSGPSPAGVALQDGTGPVPRFRPLTPFELAGQRRSGRILQDALSSPRPNTPPPTPQYADRPGMPAIQPQANSPSMPTPVPTK